MLLLLSVKLFQFGTVRNMSPDGSVEAELGGSMADTCIQKNYNFEVPVQGDGVLFSVFSL